MALRGRLIAFFLVSYAFTWSGYLGKALWPSPNWPGMNPLGPLISLLVVVPFFGGRSALGEWWQRIRIFRAPGPIWAAAIVGPIAIVLVSVIAARALGATVHYESAPPIVDFVVLMPIMIFLGPLPEELSFRGYGQHELQERIPAAIAALWIGLGVAIWHLPLFITGSISLTIAVTLFAVSVVYAWLYIAGGSIWPVVGLHWAHNLFGGELAGSILDAGGRETQVLILTLCYILWAVLLVWRLGLNLGHAAAPVLEPAEKQTS